MKETRKCTIVVERLPGKRSLECQGLAGLLILKLIFGKQVVEDMSKTY
jgi:hypothetical protein